jgi:hypothetical protein
MFAAVRVSSRIIRRQPWTIPPTILRMLLLFIPTTILLYATDASKMYHAVRGQDTIKLYVIFNALEVRLAHPRADARSQTGYVVLSGRMSWTPFSPRRPWHLRRKLAKDAGDSKLARRSSSRSPWDMSVRTFACPLTLVVHTIVYFYMLVSLNVAINSYDYTLLSLLISNQFVEIKGCTLLYSPTDDQPSSRNSKRKTCFKSCVQVRPTRGCLTADIVERFQLGLMLSVIAVRNMIEMSGSDIAFLPKSFIRGKSLVETILSVRIDRI